MPEARTLPIPAEHREFTITVDGEALSREHQLLAATVTKRVNRISSARLVFQDGSASSSDFPLSNAATFVPGAEVEVLAGSNRDPVSLFKGIVVRQSVKVRDHSAPQLIVDCRHKAAKMTVGRRNARFEDVTDADIIESLLRDAGIQADVESTSARHPQQVQFRSTDWDFLLARAGANGRLVLTNGEAVEVKAPRFDGEPVCSLQFGATVLEFDAEIDARAQFASVKAITWDPARQGLVEREAADPRVTGPGNLTTVDLAAVAALDAYELRHTAVAEDEAQAWADAEWLASQMNRVVGRAKCEGIPTVNPGSMVSVSGVGERYSGKAFVAGVRQDFDTVHGWKTHVQFGGPERGREERRVAGQSAGALLPPVQGLQVAIVTSNEDPDGEHRVRVRLPLVSADDEGIWARIASLDAGAERGFFFRPEIDDEVVVGFFDEDPRRPVVLGMLHSSAKAAPLQGSDDNHEKVYQSRSKLKLYFNDDKKVVRLETPAGNQITLTEDEKAIHIADQNGNTIDMTSDGIAIKSAKAIEIKAGTGLKVESGTGWEAKGGSTLKLAASGSAEVSSSGITTIKGAQVHIN